MSVYEFFDKSGDQGMLVVGLDLDQTFRQEADAHGRPDERLITIEHPEELLEHDALVLAAAGRLAVASTNL